MQTNEEFRIEVSLSKERFVDKKISNAMIGSVKKNPEYRQTRKDYGFDSRSGVSFDDERLLTPSELLNELITGAAICPVFHPSKRKKNGGFGSYQKKNRNFCYSSFIGVDIDKTSYSSPEQFIDKLNLKPTLWYTSYSNMTRDEEKDYEGPRFRLIYVFNSYIDSPLYFRYCSSLLNDIIIKDTGERINDTCNVRCTQYYNGTNIYNEELNVSYGITNIIYGLEDIGVNLSKSSDKDYIEFLCRCCDYKSLSKNQRYEIKRELKRTTLKDYFYHYNKKIFEIPQFSSTTINGQTEKDRTLQYEWEYEFYETETFSPSIKTILYDWDKRTTEDFMKCTQWINAVKNTKYVYRKEREWGDKKYQWVDDDYFSLFLFRKRQKDRQKRRKTLYERMCLRRILSPEITMDEMVVNTIIDIIRYFDREDGVLNSDFITDKVEWCFSFSIDELKDEFRGTIDYLIKKTKPKRGYILRSGVEDSQEMTYEILDDIYDRNYNANDNIKIIKEHPQYNFSKSTVYGYCDNRGIKTDKDYLSDEEIMELIDLSLPSDNKIHGWFKDNGFRVGDKRLRKLIRRKKDMVVKSINGGGGFNNNSSTTINGQAEKDRTFTNSDERDNMVSVKSNQQTSTTINVEIKKGDKNNKNEPVSSSGDWKVDEFLRENYSEWGEAWEEEHNKEYHRQKEIYSTMSNEDILDDIVSWVNDIQKS